MTDRPILFSAPMIRALLDGRKTQTRRTLKFHPAPGISIVRKTIRPIDAAPYHSFERRSVYGNYAGELEIKIKRGDRLWVREALAADSNDQGHRWITYAADKALPSMGAVRWDWKRDSVPSIHMPRWMSRLTLTVTDVRVERLQGISGEDAKAEGLIEIRPGFWWYTREHRIAPGSANPITAYSCLWEEINGPGAWDANPWIVAYTFTVHHGNIDQIGGAA